MKISNPVHPSEIILECFLNSPDFVIFANKTEYVKSLILNKSDINQESANILASFFQTSIEYWLNLQKQYKDSLEKPLQDMSISFDDSFKGAKETLITGIPSKVLIGYDQKPNNKEIIAPVYMLTEQAYKYLLSKCTADEAWDLGWLGQSKEHAISKNMPEKLKDLIKKEKSNETTHD